jgi:hypothetical protein
MLRKYPIKNLQVSAGFYGINLIPGVSFKRMNWMPFYGLVFIGIN